MLRNWKSLKIEVSSRLLMINELLIAPSDLNLEEFAYSDRRDYDE